MRTTAAIEKIRSQNVTLATESATPSLKNLFQDCRCQNFVQENLPQSRNCRVHFCQELEHGVCSFRNKIQYSHGQLTLSATAQRAPLSLSSPAT